MSEELKPFILSVPKGETLFSEGDAGSEMYFIHSGKVRIEKQVAGERQVLAVMEKGDFFGEMAVIDNIPRQATAVVEEEAELLRIDSANFEKLLQNNIEIAVRMIRKYSARLRESNEKLKTLMTDRKQMDHEIQQIIESTKKPAESEVTAPSEILAQFKNARGREVLTVTKPEITIGRTDPVTGIVPDVDLGVLDVLRSVSRRHARLQRVEGQFLLIEEVGVANGTTANGVRLTPGVPMTITDSAKVTFGQVELEFRIPSSNG